MRDKENKVNIKARVNRHLRIVRKSGGLHSNVLNDKRFWYSLIFVVIFFVFIFPVYPSLASFVYNNSNYDFYRWYIDESSIIEAYYGWELQDWAWTYWIPIIESEDSFLSVNTVLNDHRDLTWSNEVISYEVKPWESFSSIAYSFNVSVNSILRANDFNSSHTLRPWELIVVPPVTWVLHQVVRGDTISSIAKKYDIWESVIRTQNWLTDSNIIRIWQVIVVPWAVKPVSSPSYTTPTWAATSWSSGTSGTSGASSSWGWYSFAASANSQMTTDKWSYKLVRRKPQHSFAWWNCTRYVSQYKNVNWWGNANQWMKNAAAKWHSTGYNPRVWAIIQFSWTWYNPRYWHVWIVMEVYSDHIIVSDMNYRRINEITYRTVPINDRSIDWYIYVD